MTTTTKTKITETEKIQMRKDIKNIITEHIKKYINVNYKNVFDCDIYIKKGFFYYFDIDIRFKYLPALIEYYNYVTGENFTLSNGSYTKLYEKLETMYKKDIKLHEKINNYLLKINCGWTYILDIC